MGLDELIDVAEDGVGAAASDLRSTLDPETRGASPRGKHRMSEGGQRGLPQRAPVAGAGDVTSFCGAPVAKIHVELDELDAIGTDRVLRKNEANSENLLRRAARETSSALATSLLQILGPFNYVRRIQFAS